MQQVSLKARATLLLPTDTSAAHQSPLGPRLGLWPTQPRSPLATHLQRKETRGGVRSRHPGAGRSEVCIVEPAHPSLLLLLLQASLQDLLLVGNDTTNTIDKVALVVRDEANEDLFLGGVQQHEHADLA